MNTVNSKDIRKWLEAQSQKAILDMLMAQVEFIETRNMAGVSQAVFAHYLNVSVGSVSKWERGEKHPSGPALKLLDLVRRKGLEAIA